MEALFGQIAESQGLKTAWHGHSSQTVVGVLAKYQCLKTAWQVHSFQTLIVTFAKCQGHSFQALVEIFTECQGLKTVWQGHSCEALVKLAAKCQSLKAAWQCHSFQAHVKHFAKYQVLKAVVDFSNTSWLLHLLSRPLPPMQARLVDLVQQAMQHRNPLEDKCKRVLQHSPCLAPAMLCAVSDPSPWVQFVATLPEVNPYQMGSSPIWIIDTSG